MTYANTLKQMAQAKDEALNIVRYINNCKEDLRNEIINFDEYVMFIEDSVEQLNEKIDTLSNLINKAEVQLEELHNDNMINDKAYENLKFNVYTLSDAVTFLDEFVMHVFG